MYSQSFLSTVALFFLAASSANAAPRESQGPHQILARSPHLSLRQADGANGVCTRVCERVQDKLVACGVNAVCLCASSMSVPYHDCLQCTYSQATDVSLKSEMVDAFNDYVDACKDARHPVTGDTNITGVDQESASKRAIGLSTSFVSGVALPVAALAVSGFTF